jgi:uncharacterized membrane protein
LTNTGNVADAYTLQLTSSRGWANLLSPTTLNLSPGKSIQVQVAINIPENAIFPQMEISTVKITSKTNPAISTSVTDTTSIAYETLMLPFLKR